MREVMYWISMALMLFATGMNAYAWYRSTQSRKHLDELAELYEKSIADFRAAQKAYEDGLDEYSKLS